MEPADQPELAARREGTTTQAVGDLPDPEHVTGVRVVLVEGPGAPREWLLPQRKGSIGSFPTNDVVIEEPTVSRFHCELEVDEGGVRLRDLGSRNGTFVDGTRVFDAAPRPGSLVRLGRAAVRVELARTARRAAAGDAATFGDLVGRSPAMREVFAVLARAAPRDATVLIEGETGTGKERAAKALHAASPRRDGPFVVVDCSAIAPTLIESELFGHERGAFTGAVTGRAGAFETAHGGTIFLDEIGELPVEMQPRLLRVLEEREVRRVGSSTPARIDVRVVAATNRDLRGEVNRGAFRPDLYFRLAVVRLRLPALRERIEDVPLLVERFLELVDAPADLRALMTAPDRLAELQGAAWPGNVRELRNYVEQCAILGACPPLASCRPAPAAAAEIDVTVPFKDARRRVLAEFERRYFQVLLARHGGNVSAAARTAGISRVSLYEILKRLSL